MAEVDTIDVKDAAAATQTVATQSKVIKTLGVPADAAATATDTTAVTHTSLLKQISKTLQAAVASIAGSLFVRLGDGTNAVTVTDAAPSASSFAAVVAIHPDSVNSNGTKTSTNSAPVVLASDQATLSVAADTSMIANGSSGTTLTPKFAVIGVSSATESSNVIVAAVTSKKIRVLAYNFIANGTVNVKFSSDPAGTPGYITGLKYCVANSGICAGFNPVGWFETASGKALGANLSAGVAIGGELVYVEI